MFSSSIRKVGIVGNHSPRQCGLATYTADLAASISGAGVEAFVVAVDDNGGPYDYPDVVTYHFDDQKLESYAEGARRLNDRRVDVVCVQHEYGIYGGETGRYVLELIRELHAPVVTTFHTILQDPNPDQKEVLVEVAQLSNRVVTMSRKGAAMLTDVYGIDPDKIEFLFHGIPDVERSGPAEAKRKLGLDDKKVILTFGLISPDKGIQDVVDAMPAIVAKHPDAIYVIAGATHPKILSHSGDVYRESLKSEIATAGVSNNVQFVNRFLTSEDLSLYLEAADIYVTPYLKEQQITSGTLSYALGSGNAVVSTPYWHASELLSDSRGLLVPFRSPEAISNAINDLLDHPEKLRAMQDRAFEYGRQMRWPVVGRRYVEVFEAAVQDNKQILKPSGEANPARPPSSVDFDLDLGHFLNLVDDVGIAQHATYNVPNRLEGYCTDDVARAALVAIQLERSPSRPHVDPNLSGRFLAFLNHAFNRSNGRFRNFMSYDRRWLEDAGSEDSHSRAIWGLGAIAHHSVSAGHRALAAQLIKASVPALSGFASIRSWTFALLGLDRYLRTRSDGYIEDVRYGLAKRLMAKLAENELPSWHWFEDRLTYDNARISQALITSGTALGDPAMLSKGLMTLDWLNEIHEDRQGHFASIGSNGFYPKGGTRAWFDQQPVEAWASVEANFEAWIASGKNGYLERARWSAAWFTGSNMLGMSMVDYATGGCFDGLAEDGPNLNMGAESTTALVSSILSLREVEQRSYSESGNSRLI